jgi:putative membrane protein
VQKSAVNCCSLPQNCLAVGRQAVPDSDVRPVDSPRTPPRLARNLALAFAVLLLWSGYAPWHRQDWLLENMLVVMAFPLLWLIHRHQLFSPASWWFVFAFFCLHEVGAHYTYSEVPYNAWWQRLTGRSLHDLTGWQRNHFDRLIHVAYGLALVCPFRELAVNLLHVAGYWSHFVALNFILSTSALYELIEWGAASMFGGDLGVAYVGTQGDPWDAQKDMALAVGGAIAALLISMAYRHFFHCHHPDKLVIASDGLH